MKFYIATKLENHEAHNRLRDILEDAGHQITYDWTEHGSVYRCGLERISEIAQKEVTGVLDADVVVVLWPGGRGTHVEMGLALGTNRTCVIFVSDVDGHHVASQETCAFYHHPFVIRVRSVDDVLGVVNDRRALMGDS